MEGVIDRERLVKLLGMLGGDQPGERDAAARATDALLRSAGMTWREIIAPSRSLPAPERDSHDDWREQSAWMVTRLVEFYSHRLSPRELQFVCGIKDQQHPPSPRQSEILREIYARRVPA